MFRVEKVMRCREVLFCDPQSSTEKPVVPPNKKCIPRSVTMVSAEQGYYRRYREDAIAPRLSRNEVPRGIRGNQRIDVKIDGRAECLFHCRRDRGRAPALLHCTIDLALAYS